MLTAFRANGRARRAMAVAGAVTALGFASSANAQAVFNLGDIVVGSDAVTEINLSIPTGTYTSYSLTTDWSVASGDPWSNEAVWAMTEGPNANPGTIYASPGASPDSQSNGNATTLTWNGFLNFELNSPPTTDAFFLALQQFDPSSANWDNTVLTLDNQTATPPTPDFTASTGGSFSYAQSAGQITFIKFEYTGGALSIDTNGSDLPDPSGGTFVNDTEIALYNDFGGLLATDDDGAGNTGTGESALFFDDGVLQAGTYYLAVGTFDTVFASGYDVTTSSTDVGTIQINGLNIVPEPGSLALLGLAGLTLVRRRR